MDGIEIIEKDGQLEASPVAPPTTDDVDLLPLQGYFNITGRTTGRATNQLQKILEYARGEAQSNDQVQVLMTLRHLENRMGAPKTDESRMGMVYNYIRAQEAVKQAEEARDSMLR